MKNNEPKVGASIIVLKDNKILLGLLTKKWLYNNAQVYGVPGRGMRFGEKISETAKRNIRENLGCTVIFTKYFLLTQITPWERWEWHEVSELPANLFPSSKKCYR